MISGLYKYFTGKELEFEEPINFEDEPPLKGTKEVETAATVLKSDAKYEVEQEEVSC